MASHVRFLRHLTVTFLVLALTPTLALSAPRTRAQSYFEAGTQAFRAGHYRRAADQFEQAHRAGMDSAALWYNLGVAYYQMHAYDKAESAFRRTAHYRAMAPVAYYNLGLVALDRDRVAEARGWFERARDETNDPKLRMLAIHMLDRTTHRRRNAQRWVAILYAGLGHDNNITLENTSLAQASGKSDVFAQLFAAANGVLSGNRRDGLLLKASAYELKYGSQSQFDMSLLNAGLYKTRPFGNWGGEAGVSYTHSTLGGRGYLGMAALTLQATDYATRDLRVRLRYRYRSDSSLDSRYAYLDGHVHELRAGARWQLDNGRRVHAFYRLEIERRSDLRTATTFTSFSPTRHTLHVDFTTPIAERWDFNGMVDYRRSRYADPSVLAGGQSIRREDNRLRERLTLTRRLNRRAVLQLRLTHTANHSNIALYQYSRNVLSAAVEYVF